MIKTNPTLSSRILTLTGERALRLIPQEWLFVSYVSSLPRDTTYEVIDHGDSLSFRYFSHRMRGRLLLTTLTPLFRGVITDSVTTHTLTQDEENAFALPEPAGITS